MITLHIEFQEGWTGESVDVALDGAPLGRWEPVTRLQLGLAAATEVDVSPGRHSLAVRLPGSHGPSSVPAGNGAAAPEVIDVDANADVWIGLSRHSDGTLGVRTQPTLFGYV